MYRNLFFINAVIAVLLIVSCKLFEKEDPKPIEVYGCMDSTATNYNPEATIDDGSCDYCKEGSAFILLSTDGGQKWDIRCLKDTIGKIVDISMVDSNNIWLCTYPSSEVKNAQILHTSNGGRTWEKQIYFDSPNPYSEETFEYIEMFDLNNGIALANHITNEVPIFLKTIDGGKNWIQTTTEAIGVSGDLWRRVDFVDVNTGYFYESLVNPQKLYKTTNSGLTWEVTNFDNQAHVLKFYDINIGLVVYWNKIYRTLDGGKTWALIDTLERGWGLDIEFDPNDPSRVWMLSGGLFFSNDTGSTWNFCIDNTYNGADAICLSESSLWVYYRRRYLRKFETENCDSYLEYQLPEYSYGSLSLGHNFDVVDNTIVIPGHISE